MKYLKSLAYWLWVTFIAVGYTKFTIDCIIKISEASGWAVVGWFTLVVLCVVIVVGVSLVFILNITKGTDND